MVGLASRALGAGGVRGSNRTKSALRLPKDERRDRRVLARGGRDHEGVKELVVPEDGRHVVGLPPRVDERADGVEKPAREDERDRRRADTGKERSPS